MQKPNQIPFFHAVRRPNGNVDYYWKPSRKWRAAGYRNEKLPDVYKLAAARAIDLNEALPDEPPAPIAGGPRTVRSAIADYKADDSYKALRPGSKRTYDCYLRAIDRRFTLADGKPQPLSQISRPMIEAWRDELKEDPRVYGRVDLLRIAAVFFQFCENNRWLAHPARKLGVKAAPYRKHRLLREDLQLLTGSANALGLSPVAAAIPLGFYTMQRKGDLLAATGFQLRPMDDISAEARRALAGPDGRALGLFLEQEKTTVPVGIALVPELRAAIVAALNVERIGAVIGTHLIASPNGAGAYPKRQFERDFRAVVDHACALATGPALERLRGIQFRDLRRSGMCWLRDLGVPVALIAANSGHSIEETQDILDRYMPRDTRGAAEGLAMAVTKQAERDAAELGGAHAAHN